MKNALEPRVRGIHRELLARHAGFCSCEQCADDVVALALNQSKPRYVSQNSVVGEIVTDVQLTWDQNRAEMTVRVFDAMRRVASSPGHPVVPVAQDENKGGAG